MGFVFSICVGYLLGLIFLGAAFIYSIIYSKKIVKNNIIVKILCLCTSLLAVLGVFSYAIYYKVIEQVVPEKYLLSAYFSGFISIGFSMYLYHKFGKLLEANEEENV